MQIYFPSGWQADVLARYKRILKDFEGKGSVSERVRKLIELDLRELERLGKQTPRETDGGGGPFQ